MIFKKAPFLSKTKYLDGLTCPKLLWYEYNRKQDIPGPDNMMKSVMEEGRRVGEMAQRLFPGGIRVERHYDPEKTNERSVRVLSERKPIFEAGFVHKGAYALADILSPSADGSWDIFEVKSSSSVKAPHYDDLAFQKYTYTGAGLKINKTYLMHLNREYIKNGEIEPEKLFAREDLTEAVDARLGEIEASVEAMLKVIKDDKAPEVKVGSQCSGCPLKEICWSFLPGSDNVFLLHRAGKVAYELMELGILKLKDIPEAFELSPRHLAQKESILSGRAHVEKGAIREFIDRLKYPLFFLDFETIAPGIPIYDLTHPYEDLPFQYSLHVIRKEGEAPEHYEYLAPGKDDPRPEVLKRLKDLLGDNGSIIAYNAKYEMDCIKKAVNAFPEYADWSAGIEPRFIDLWEPFKNFNYYNPAQGNSTSMKSVLPAFTGEGYEGLNISEGATARIEYMRIAFGKNIDPIDSEKVRSDLLKYCELDTKGMIDILSSLKKLV